MATTLLDSLQRPVYFLPDDKGWLISEFGNQTGGLNYYDTSGQKSDFVPLPGSYKSFYFDYNKDGEKEYLGLFSQAREGVIRVDPLLNGQSKFTILLQFPSLYGSSDMDTADINRDGFTDLIITFGDNADFSNQLKNYHGVAIYINDQEGSFIEAYRYPFYGATQVKALDFNKDGNLDIAVSAYFPYSEKTSLLFLENQSTKDSLSFEPYGSEQSDLGRWLIMEKGDFDDDGDIDLALGSYIKGPTTLERAIIQEWSKKSIDIILFLAK